MERKLQKIIVTLRNGSDIEIDAQDDISVMENIRNSGVDELLALCGGSCSCATCHVYIDEEFSRAVSEMSQDEDDLLETSGHRKISSRLSCQLKFRNDLNGLKVTIAPED
jgi:2Fe-2S ferredoxin